MPPQLPSTLLGLDQNELRAYVEWSIAHVPLLLLQAVTIITLTFLLLHIDPVKRSLAADYRSLWFEVLLVLLFSSAAMLGDRSCEYRIEVKEHSLPTTGTGHKGGVWCGKLRDKEVIIDIRDMAVATAGLSGGPWVGLSAGTIAGLHRYYLGSSVAEIAATATILIGLLAGLIA